MFPFSCTYIKFRGSSISNYPYLSTPPLSLLLDDNHDDNNNNNNNHNNNNTLRKFTVIHYPFFINSVVFFLPLSFKAFLEPLLLVYSASTIYRMNDIWSNISYDTVMKWKVSFEHVKISPGLLLPIWVRYWAASLEINHPRTNLP